MDTGNLVQLFYGFEGRINRAKYWLAVGVFLAIAIVLTLLAIMLGLGVDVEDLAETSLSVIVIAIIVYIPMLIAGIAVGMKRLHDRNKSGWWLVLFYAAPALLSWLGGENMILSLVSFIISIWAIVELGFLRGTPGANSYGPDPLNL
ncbi:MAG: DUF805 domain-containing protein [Hyphomicrobiales bacterium]